MRQHRRGPSTSLTCYGVGRHACMTRAAGPMNFLITACARVIVILASGESKPYTQICLICGNSSIVSHTLYPLQMRHRKLGCSRKHIKEAKGHRHLCVAVDRVSKRDGHPRKSTQQPQASGRACYTRSLLAARMPFFLLFGCVHSFTIRQ